MISWISDVPILDGWPDHWRRHSQLLLALAVMAVLAVALIALELLG